MSNRWRRDEPAPAENGHRRAPLLPGIFPVLERAALLRGARCPRAGLARENHHAGGRPIFQRVDPGRRGLRASAKTFRAPDPREAWKAAWPSRAFISARGKEPGALRGGAACATARPVSRNAGALPRSGRCRARGEPVEPGQRAEGDSPVARFAVRSAGSAFQPASISRRPQGGGYRRNAIGRRST